MALQKQKIWNVSIGSGAAALLVFPSLHLVRAAFTPDCYHRRFFQHCQEELKNNRGQDALVVAMRAQIGKWWRGAKIVGKGVSKRAQYVPGVKMVSGDYLN